MTIANNHLNDFGEFPVNYTVNTLRNAGIKAVGATYGPFNSHQVINNYCSMLQSEPLIFKPLLIVIFEHNHFQRRCLDTV